MKADGSYLGMPLLDSPINKREQPEEEQLKNSKMISYRDNTTQETSLVGEIHYTLIALLRCH